MIYLLYIIDKIKHFVRSHVYDLYKLYILLTNLKNKTGKK